MSDVHYNPADRARPGCRRAHPLRGRLLAAIAIVAVLVAAAGLAVALHVRGPAETPAGQLPAQAGPLPPAGQNSLLPAKGVLVGSWVQPTAGYTVADQESAVTDFERIIGRKLAIDNLYIQFGEPTPTQLANWSLRHHQVPMISWAGISSAQVVSGRYNQQLRERAKQLKALHGPVLLRYFPEMNNTFVSKTAGSPATFIAAWRHIYKIFKAVGASNVQWVWCPTSIGFSAGNAQLFYPGETYVNWIGADGYNWAPSRPGAHWRDFALIFAAFYEWAERQGRPLMIDEFGTDEGSAGQKAAWFSQMGQALQTEFPRMRAIVYFNSKRMNFGHVFDWKVNSSRSALAAFRAVVREPYFDSMPKF